MRKFLLSTLLVIGLAGIAVTVGGVSGCTPSSNPSPNPACATANNGISSAAQALGLAKGAWSIAQVFITNPVVAKAITTALDAANAGITSAQTSIAAGNCDVASYINAAVAAIQTALADIAHNQPAQLAGSGPNNVSTLINQSNALAEQAKAAVGK